MSAPAASAAPTASLLIVGDEILSGRTKDANLAFLGERLASLGVPLREVRVVPDLRDEIVAAVDALRGRYTYLFTTGGIGPTHDDITAECVAAAFGVPLLRHPEAVRRLRAHYENPADLNEARLRMANVPEGGTLIDNPVSAAPGFRIGNVFVMAGVPRIMQAMFDGVAEQLSGGPPIQSRTVACDLGEGVIAEGLGRIAADFPDLSLGSYPYFRAGAFGTSLVVRGSDPGRLDQAAGAIAALVGRLGGTARRRSAERGVGESQDQRDAQPERDIGQRVAVAAQHPPCGRPDQQQRAEQPEKADDRPFVHGASSALNAALVESGTENHR